MSKRMYANVPDNTYNDLMCGRAVDNNGIRMKNGTFHPEQPTFEPIYDSKEQAENALQQLVIAAGGYIVFKIVLPEAKRFAHEKVYPAIAKKWDSWQEKRECKRVEKLESENARKENANHPENARNSEEGTCRIIKFENKRKLA